MMSPIMNTHRSNKGPQTAVCTANKFLRANKNIRVALFPEPRNPVNAKAIAIKCQLDDNE